MNSTPKITILGAGSFGTSMACLLQSNGLDVTLWAREESVVDEICTKKTNSRYFDDAQLADFKVTHHLSEALNHDGYLVFAIPCQYVRNFLMSCRDLIPKKALLVNLAKGLEISHLQLPHQIFADCLGADIKNRYASISGPTFAREIFNLVPSGAVVASSSLRTAQKIQDALSTKFFRLYAGKDIMGVELGGALKNVMALGVGIADGLNFGLNTRAGLMTRCLHEMTELGIAMGAKQRTFAGLSGVGDLILTCTGDLSRNRQVGLRLGRGETIDDILKSMNNVAEGVATAKSVFQINQKYKVEMPNAEHVYKIIYENLAPREAVNSILKRGLKTEF